MTGRLLRRCVALLLALTIFSLASAHTSAQAPAGILTRDQAGPLLPPSVFYRGQVAPIQARNSAGYKSPDGKLFLTALVDTSGYATSIQQTYQGYLICELPLNIAGKTLPPGAYGFGFVAGNRMVVMDVGGNEVLAAGTTSDAALPRPNPLQIVPDSSSKSAFRLYLGRNYVTISAGSK